eukprot:12499652-Ditylum_brightwellii.AAC.1
MNYIWVPAIPGSHWVNSDHILMYRDDSSSYSCSDTSSYSWGVKNSGRRQVATGGAKKDRLTLQLTYAKDGTKLP